MRTLEQIRDRCFIEDGHWLWRGSLRPDGRANIFAPDYTNGGAMSVQSGPRAMWHCKEGRAIPAGWRVYGTCNVRECVNPAHMACGPCAELGRHIQKTCVLKNKVNRIVANRLAGQTRTKLTPELIREILDSPETGRALALRLQLSETTVSKARRGEALSFQPVGGIFANLMCGR